MQWALYYCFFKISVNFLTLAFEIVHMWLRAVHIQRACKYNYVLQYFQIWPPNSSFRYTDIHIHYHYWMQYLLILWKQLEVEETCYAKHRDKVKIDSILKSSIFKHLTGWGDFPSSFRKLFNCPKEQSTGEFSPDTSSRFSLSKLNCFIHVDSSGDSPSSVHIKTAAEKFAKMTAKHILLLLLPVLQLCSFQSELCVYSLRDL